MVASHIWMVTSHQKFLLHQEILKFVGLSKSFKYFSLKVTRVINRKKKQGSKQMYLVSVIKKMFFKHYWWPDNGADEFVFLSVTCVMMLWKFSKKQVLSEGELRNSAVVEVRNSVSYGGSMMIFLWFFLFFFFLLLPSNILNISVLYVMMNGPVIDCRIRLVIVLILYENANDMKCLHCWET